jgi:signal transduction histidine kinase/ActR/RegA family two-component response regulator
MKLRLRTLLVGLTTLAIIVVEVGEIALEVRDRVRAAERRLAAQTQGLATAGAPLLVNALVVGDLATAEQVLRHLNADLLWRRVILYESDGRQQILDASPTDPFPASAAQGLARLLPIARAESRLTIAAGQRVYAVLAVTPSPRVLEEELWAGIRSVAVTTALLVGVVLVLTNLILVYGLRPIQELGRSAARLGAGDLSARMDETGLVEIAPTVHAFNTMAANLEKVTAERRRTEQRQAAQFAVTRVLAETEKPHDAIARILEAIGRSIEWDRAEFWRRDVDADVLRQEAFWRRDDLATPGADVMRPGLAVRRGEGLAARVWTTGQSVWAPVGDGDPASGVDGAAAAAGFATAFGFPVRGREVIGVIVFLHRKAQPRDYELLTTMTDIGGQIGQFLERREAEDALRATEEQLRQTQKMEAIGKLAGGVAHDFNNLLTVILGRCELLIERLGTKDPAGRDLVLIRATAQRAATLTRQLLAFGRKQVLQPRPLDLNAVVEGISPMLRRLVGEDVEQVVRLRPGVGRVMADPSQIEQVILNLVINARDAMPKGGRLTIETANVEPDAAYLRRHPGVNAGAQVMLAVSDTGVGMDAETRARIFEPFFTTKEPGKGTGLGLATVHGIVEQSGGTVFAYSEPQQGSVFKVYLPRLDSAVISAGPAPVTVAAPRGSETILLVEDEVEVRELARDVLEMHGYTVLEAGEPDEARRLFSANREAISLLLTDVVMPQASGRDLANLLCPLRPEMKVLYMSGYTDQAIVHHGVLEAGVAYLEKPFTIEGLMRKVRDVLDAPAAANGSS